MSINRLRLLQHASNLRRAMTNPDLPQSLKDQARKALNHAEVALGLDSAIKRKGQRKTSSVDQ